MARSDMILVLTWAIKLTLEKYLAGGGCSQKRCNAATVRLHIITDGDGLHLARDNAGLRHFTRMTNGARLGRGIS